MSYKWPGIPNGDYSFDHGRAVWNKIINYLRRLSEKLDEDIVDATADRRGMMTATDKDKLDGVEPGAEVNQNAFSGVKVGSSVIEADGKTDVLELVAGTGIELTVDTTNDKVTIGGTEVSTTAAGLMSATDKSKLDGITAEAEVNQNTFSNIKVGSTTIAADTKTDTIELAAGTGITLTPDAANDKVAIKVTDNTYFPIGGGALTGTSIVRNRNDTWLWLNGGTDWNKGGQILFYGPEYSDASLRGVVQIRAVIDETSIKNLNCYPNGDLTWNGNQIVTFADAATSTKDGLLTATDKSKLDGITAGAEPNQNAFSTIKVGSTSITADTKTDTVQLVAGTGITLTPNSTDDKIQISVTANTYADANHTHNYVSRAGDTLTGTNITRTVDDSWLWFNGGSGWTKGGQLQLYGESYGTAAYKGVAALRATAPNIGDKYFMCYPNGDLTWDGVDVVTLAKYLLSFDTSSNPRPYIAKLPNGVMIEAFLSGGIAVDSNGRVTLTFPEAFLDTPICVFGKYSASYDFSIYSSNTARVIVRCTNSSGSALASGTNVGIAMIALGRWK